MNTALCTLDGVTYLSTDFSTITDFANKKRYLVCTECGGPAFYRGPTRNGREACFGARPHGEGCTLATLDNDGLPRGQEEDEVFTSGQRIVVDFNHGIPAVNNAEQPTGRQTVVGAGRSQSGEGAASRETISRRMSTLLRSLVESEEFRRSPQIIEVSGQGEYAIADFFVNFSEITAAHVGTYHGYWGMIPDARRDANGTLWFNSGGRDNVSILLDQEHIEAFYQRFRIDDEEDIAGAYLLVFGELATARSGKGYVVITDPSRVALRLAR